MSTFWIIVLVVVIIYLFVGIVAWLWFGFDELKHLKPKAPRKLKIHVFTTTIPFIVMWGWIVIIILTDE